MPVPAGFGATLDVQAGDVLSVTGNGRLARLGAHGGFMGHVLVVLNDAQPLPAGLPEGSELRRHLRLRSTCDLWKVRTLESTRSQTGLHSADMLLRSDDETGKLILVGELSIDKKDLSLIDSEAVEVWQSPPELQKNFRLDLMELVVADMKDREGDWSLVTAARALLNQGSDLRRERSRRSLQQIKDCWNMDPICTSVVVVFWQRYLFRLSHQASTQGGTGHLKENATKLIMKWMPLKSDGVLPGALTKVMRDCGWARKTQTSKLLVWDI